MNCHKLFIMTLIYKKLQYINQIFMFEYQKASVALESTLQDMHNTIIYIYNMVEKRFNRDVDEIFNQYFVSRKICWKYKEIDQIFIFNMSFSWYLRNNSIELYFYTCILCIRHRLLVQWLKYYTTASNWNFQTNIFTCFIFFVQ